VHAIGGDPRREILMIADRFRKSLLTATLAATVAWAAAPPAMAAGFANPQLAVSVSWLQQHMNDNGLVVVDARPADAYAKGHLPNAVSLPVTDTFDPDQKKNFPDTKAKLEALFGSHGIGDSTQVVVYDNGKETPAARLFWTLEYSGHKHVSVLDGGIGAWQAAVGVVDTKSMTPKAATFHAAIDPARMPTRETCTAALGNPGKVVVDARSAAEYRGDDVRAKRGGHMPGAVNIEWKANFNDLTLKSADELSEMYATAGVTKDKEVIAHCQTGQRSSVTYLALRLLGYPKVGNYAGSWVEWGNDPDTQIVTGP
jgi:thiosulfate/3-mercaptopyruvate sulfurtransferase